MCTYTCSLANAFSNSILSRHYKGMGIIQPNFSCHLGRQGWEEKAPKDVLTRDLYHISTEITEPSVSLGLGGVETALVITKRFAGILN